MRTETIKGSEQLRSDLYTLKEIIDLRIGEVDPLVSGGSARSRVCDMIGIWKTAEGRYGVVVRGTSDWDGVDSFAEIAFDCGLNIESASVEWSDSNFDRIRDINTPSQPAFVAKILEAVQFELEQEKFST